MAAMMGEVSTSGPSLSLRQSPRSAEVIVVGGGLAGLQAALDIQEAGLTCLVLDAKSHDVADSGSHLYNLQGAIPKYGKEHQRLTKLAERLGIDLQSRDSNYSRGDNNTTGYSRNLSETDQRSLTRVLDNLEGLIQAVDVNYPAKLLPNYGTTSVHELVVSHGATKAVQEMAEQWAATIFGLSSKDVSGLFFLYFCKTWGGIDQVLSHLENPPHDAESSSRLCEALREELRPGSLIYSQTVELIDQTSPTKCTLTMANGEVYYCTKVILTVPVKFYNQIQFQPSLSNDKEWLLTHDMEPSTIITNMQYDHPWWQEGTTSLSSHGLKENASTLRDTSSKGHGIYSLTSVIGGEMGRTLLQKPRERQLAAVLDHVHAALGADIPTPTKITENIANWDCLAVPATQLRSLEKDQWQPEGNIHFAGADTSYSWKGHLEGALASGSREARGVIDALRSDISEHPLARL